jgi:hypothetical protein
VAASAPLNETELDQTYGCSQRLISDLVGIEPGNLDGVSDQIAQRPFPAECQDHRQRDQPYSSALFSFALVLDGEEGQFALAVVVQVVEDVLVTGEGEVPSLSG